MTQETDEALARRAAGGDKWAFVELVRRCEAPVANLIRFRVGSPDDAEDVLQETLISAWAGISLLRDPASVRAWLLHVARNRCRDFWRSRQRAESPTESDDLDRCIDKSAPGLARRRALYADVEDALAKVPEAQRSAIELFYLHGFSISEIAQRHRCPEGTVKRRLFSARDGLREALGVAPQGRMDMKTTKPKTKRQPLPETRPDIVVTPLDIEPFEVDCLELKWWSIVPVVGNRAGTADYHPPDWKSMLARELSAVRKAWVHEVEGVEVEVHTWERETGWRDSSHSFFGRIRDDAVQWLGGMYRGEDTQVRTFLDEGFVWAFPDINRRLKDEGLFESLPDGSLRTTRERGECKWSGAGCFSVSIGERTFKCLRVVGLEGRIEEPKTAATEIFVSDAGRTVLIRHYCRPEAAKSMFGDVVFDYDLQLTVDGVAFVHWCDTVTGVAMGVE